MTRLPTQLFCGSRPEREKFNPALNYGDPNGPRAGAYKPHGGLWTSTWETAFDDGWPWWCLVESFHVDQLESAWLLEPADCRVFEIFQPEDAEVLMREYGTGESYSRVPAWGEVAKDWDAVRLLIPYHPDIRFGDPEKIGVVWYGWDCESTVWLSWQFEGNAKPVDLTEQIAAHEAEYAA